MLDNPMILAEDERINAPFLKFNTAEYADFLIDMYADDLEEFCIEENPCGSCVCRAAQIDE